MTSLSVVIPTHDFDCSELALSLSEQCKACEGVGTYEVIVVDDHSKIHTEELERLDRLPHVRVLQLEGGSGRAMARNAGISEAKGEWILLADADAKVASPSFIQKYVDSIKTGSEVINGGIRTLPESAKDDNRLRYLYESSAQKRHTLEYRKAHPYHNFSVFNILVRASVLDLLKFDEKISQYGHEDTLFGVRLKALGIKITHISNELVHTGIDDNRSFLNKTEQGLKNLYHLQNELREASPLIKLKDKLQAYHLIPLVKGFHSVFGKIERSWLLSHHPSLFVLKLYKVGYFANLSD